MLLTQEAEQVILRRQDLTQLEDEFLQLEELLRKGKMIITTDHGEIHSNHLILIHPGILRPIRGITLITDPVRILFTDMIAARRTAARQEAVHSIAEAEEDHVQVHQQVPDLMEERGAGIK